MTYRIKQIINLRLLVHNNKVSKLTSKVVVFHDRVATPTYSTPIESIRKVRMKSSTLGLISPLSFPSPFPWQWFR